MPEQICAQCSKEQQIDEIHFTVKDIHTRLFVGNGESIVTRLSLTEKTVAELVKNGQIKNNRWWEFAKTIFACVLSAVLALLVKGYFVK